MNDKELLRLAAKAAGIKLIFMQDDMPRNCTGMHDSMNIFSAPAWNPFTDDGDALRLAVKLFFEIDVSNVAIEVQQPNGRLLFENVDSDPCAATRRAIVRAAAEIGKGIQQKTTQNLPEDNFYKTEAEAFYGAAEIGKSK